MSVTVRPYAAEDAERWDAFCAQADQATLLHTRRFLGYHGDRFADRSLVLEADGRWVGLLPAAEHPADRSLVASHPGITYGGVLHAGALRGERMVAALEAVRAHYAAAGYSRLLYKAVPTIYHRQPSQDDLYALFRLDARRTRCDLSCTIDVAHRGAVSERRRRGLKKALKAGVAIATGDHLYAPLWDVLADNLARKHGVKPVHTLAEIQLLAGRFPDAIRCVAAMAGERVLAGVVLFVTPGVVHAQYIASSAEGYDVSALDAVFDHCITATREQGRRWFDFGISTEEAGRVLNEGLYAFKSEFGGGGVVHEFFDLALQGA